MDKKLIILMNAAVLLIIAFLIYKVIKRKVYSLKIEKINPKVSLVLVVKNNEKILKNAITIILKEKKDIGEILIMDMGSIDGTIEIIKELIKEDRRIRLLEIVHKTIIENYFSIIRGQVHGQVVLVLDLYRLGMDNPDVYVPHLFKPLNEVLSKDLPKSDSRIDGSQLLYLDNQEREKNNYVLKEYVTRPLSNIHTSMEKLLSLIEGGDNDIQRQGMEIKEYIERTARDLDVVLKLVSPVKAFSGVMEENLISLFKRYGETHRVSINYKVLGTKRKFKNPINDLILEVTQDLLYTVIQYNLSSDIDVLEKYGRNYYELLFKYQCICDEKILLDKDNGISYYVLHSIQNRLNLIGGRMRIRVKPQWKVKVLIQFPIDSTTCLSDKKKI